MTPITKKLTMFHLIMITVVSVDSIRNLPATALFGSQLIFFFSLGALLFLLPCAFISAELSSTWPKQGGIYIWIKQAFGKKIAFYAIWLQWIENVIWYPTILSFVAGAFGYLLYPPLAEMKSFLIIVIICSFWGITYINLKGIRTSAKFTTLCTIAGLLIPMALIILLGLIWILKGYPSHLNLSLKAMAPNLNDAQLWLSLTAIMLSFCGMEIATVHAADVENPQKAFPRALLYSSLIIIFTLMLGSLSLALVVPQEQISLVAGIMQAFDTFFQTYHLSFFLPFMGVAVIFGGLGGVNNWVISPAKGLLVAAEDGLLPTFFAKTNHNGAPSTLLICQAVIVTLLCVIFLLMPGINGSYWLLTALAAQLYMMMYMLMFVAAIYLRYKFPNIERPFKIPGNLFGIWTIAGMGLVGSMVTFIVSFIPPATINIGHSGIYIFILISGLVLMSCPPMIALKYTKLTTPKQAVLAQ